MKIVLAGTRAQKRIGKAQSACLSVSQCGRNTQLAKVRIRQIHTWQAGHQGALMRKTAFFLLGNIPDPLTISKKLAAHRWCLIGIMFRKQ